MGVEKEQCDEVKVPTEEPEVWKGRARDIYLSDPESTVREIADACGIEFKKMKNFLAKEKKRFLFFKPVAINALCVLSLCRF